MSHDEIEYLSAFSLNISKNEQKYKAVWKNSTREPELIDASLIPRKFVIGFWLRMARILGSYQDKMGPLTWEETKEKRRVMALFRLRHCLEETGAELKAWR